MQDTIRGATDWIKAALPDPSKKDFNTQFGVHCEEFMELLESMESTHLPAYHALLRAIDALENLSEIAKNGDHFVINDRIECLDALCDGIQTAASMAHTASLNLPDAMREVVSSNFSKYEDGKPIFNEDRKIMKGKNYYRPDLTKFV